MRPDAISEMERCEADKCPARATQRCVECGWEYCDAHAPAHVQVCEHDGEMIILDLSWGNDDGLAG